MKKTENLSFEEALEELQSIVNDLETGQQPLEKSIALFERGQALARRCAELLDAAELKVTQLTEDGAETPFPEA